MKFVFIFLALITLASCNMELLFMPAPDDFAFTPQEEDTTALPLVLDTCESLIPAIDTAFTLIATYFFNGMPIDPVWHVGQYSFTSTNLIEVLEHFWPQFEYTYYEENGAVSVFAEGQNNNSLFQGKIWTRDLVGQKAFLTAFGQSMLVFGSLTFEEAMFESTERINIELFHNANTDWTTEQYLAYNRNQLHAEICKLGQIRADLYLENDPPLPQTLVDSFSLFLWQQIILDFTDPKELLKA